MFFFLFFFPFFLLSFPFYPSLFFPLFFFPFLPSYPTCPIRRADVDRTFSCVPCITVS